MINFREQNSVITNKMVEMCRQAYSTYGTKNCSFLVAYISKGDVGTQYAVADYFINGSGSWVGTCGGLFDFDFYTVREVTGFIPIEDVIYSINFNGAEFIK